MQLILNLSRKVASTGSFKNFCIRFAEQFYLRQKTWTLDPKRHKFINYAIINQGTFRLCIANKKRFSEVDPEKAIGEKLLWAFRWNMSGIDVNASTDIGRHMSTLVRTVTTIGSDMDHTGTLKRIKSAATVTSPKPQQARASRKASAGGRGHHRRAHSLVHHPRGARISELTQLEFARQTRKLQKLKSTGVTGESLRSEEDRVRRMELELAHRVIKHPKDRFPLQKIFSPGNAGGKEHTAPGRKLSQVVRKKLFSLSEDPVAAEGELERSSRSATLSPVHSKRRTQSMAARPAATHKRIKSDVTGLTATTISPTTSPYPSPCPTPPPWEDGAFEGEPPLDDRPSSGSGVEERPPSSGSGVDKVETSGEGEELGAEEESSFIFPSIDVEVDITISVEYGTIRLQTEER